MIDKYSVIKPLRPKSNDWNEFMVPEWMTLGFDGMGFIHKDGFVVISAVEVASDKDGVNRGPEYHLSMSKNVSGSPEPTRVDSNDAQFILKEFGLEGAEEDNHVQHGKVRNFWRAVAEPLIGLECSCKDTESKIVEDKGDFIIRSF